MAPDPDSPSDSGFAITSVADPDQGSGAFLISGSGWVKNHDPDPRFRMNIPDHFSESLETIFWVKYT